jgi:hypothetical protein
MKLQQQGAKDATQARQSSQDRTQKVISEAQKGQNTRYNA